MSLPTKKNVKVHVDLSNTDLVREESEMQHILKGLRLKMNTQERKRGLCKRDAHHIELICIFVFLSIVLITYDYVSPDFQNYA